MSALGVRIWGARGSLPRLSGDQAVHGGNTVCVEVVHPGDQRVVIDAGTGIANYGDSILAEADHGQIHLFLSHYHWDHIMGLPFFGPVYRKGFSIALYGQRADQGHIEEMLNVTFSPLYSPIYSPDNLLGNLTVPPSSAVRRIDGLTVRTFELSDAHPGGCMVIRVEGFGSSFVYASDVELRNPDVVDALVGCSAGADLLLCDATFTREIYSTAVGWGHSSLEAAYDLAHRAGVKRVMGIHFDPMRTDGELREVLVRESGRFEGVALDLAREGEMVWL